MSQVHVDSPPVDTTIGGGALATAVTAHHISVSVPQPPAATVTKRSNFSISNLLATEEEKSPPASDTSADKLNVSSSHIGRADRDDSSAASAIKSMPSPATPPFFNASALAHLAHLHQGAASASPSTTSPSSANPAAAGWTDWLGTAGLGSDSHQSLWSR